MKELYRVMKSGKVALLPVHLDYGLNTTIEYSAYDPDQYGRVREYGKDYFNRLQSVGFQPIPEWEVVMAVRRS